MANGFKFPWEADSGHYTLSDVQRRSAKAERLLDGPMVKDAGPLGAIQNALAGALGGYEQTRAGEMAEAGKAETRAAIEAALANPNAGFADYANLANLDFTSPKQEAIIQALLGNEMKTNDPMYQMDLERAGLELDALRNPAPADPWQVSAGETLVDPVTREPFYTGPEAGPETVINNGGLTDAFSEAAAKKAADSFSTLIDSGYTAQANAGQLERLEGLLAEAPQGMTGGFTQALGEFGIEGEGLDEVQAATALINKMVPAQRPAGSGPMSDRDVELFKSSLPRIINQPGGNALIMETLKGINDYTMAQAQIAAKVFNGEINPATGKAYTPADGRKELMALPNPLANFKTEDEAGVVNAEDFDWGAP